MVDTLRDRKTLIFMLLIPTLAIPVLIWGINRVVANVQKKQALQVVRIIATEETHDVYRRMVHDWYLQSLVAKQNLLASKQAMEALIKRANFEKLPEAPPGILSDAVVFERWLRETAARARDEVDAADAVDEREVGDLPAEILKLLRDFHQVTFKGLGLIDFIDPSTLETAEADFEITSLPDALKAHPRAMAIAYAIRKKKVQGYLELPIAVARLGHELSRTVEATFIYDSTIPLSKEAYTRIRIAMNKMGEALLNRRLEVQGLDQNFLEPLKLREESDLATKTEVTLYVIGSFLPYIVIAFAFLGGFYPAIDLGAGEKERNTLETLLLSPTSRTEIALGKFFVILTTSLLAALLGVTSIALSARYLAPEGLMAGANFDFKLSTGALIALLAIPPAMAFSGLLLAISIFARTFKEAQNYMAPLQFIIILPAMAAMIPGLEMSWKLAMIPLVNVSLLSRDFLKGDTNWGYYALTLASCLLLAGASLAYAVYQFRKEEVLFRS